MSSKDYGPFEDLAGDAGDSKQDDGFGPFADLAASKPAAKPATQQAKPYTPPKGPGKTLSLGAVLDEVGSLGKKAVDAVGSFYAGGSQGDPVDTSTTDAMGDSLGSAIMQQAGPAPLSLAQQIERGAGKDLPMSRADARGNAEWDSLSPQGQAKVRERKAIQASRDNAPDLKAAPERTGLQNALDKTNRKPLDNSLGGLALETVGDAARGTVRGVQGVAGSAWGGIRAAADLTAGPDSAVSEIAAGATKAADQAQAGLQSPDRNSLTQQVFESTFSSVPALLAFGTGAKTLAVLGAQSGAQAYSEARNLGKTPDEAAERGVWHGLAEVMGERLSLPVLGDLFAKAASRASNQELGQVLSELLIKDQMGEQATTLLQSAYDKAGRGGTRPDMTLADYLEDMANTAKVSLGQSLLMGGGAGIARGLAKMGDKPMPQLNPFELAKSKGFLTNPPTTEDTPTVQRDRFAGMFRDLGAHFGLPKRAVDRAIEEADGIPTPALGGFFKRIAQAYERRGIFGAPVDPDVLGVFDGPMQAAQPQADAAGQQADDLEMGDATGLADDTGAQDAVQDSAQPEQDQAPRPIDLAAEAAATSPTNDKAEPTEAQKDAGNYAKGHGKFAGMDIAIENPKGSIRSGVDAQGTPWQTTMQHHYGYIKGTKGADKDHVDVFVGPGRDETRAFVIDQIDPKTGKFDEHKVIFGADTPEQAREIYQANYDKGWKGLGAITELPMQAFKSWVKDGAKRQPLGDISKAVAEADARNAVGEIGQILGATAQQPAATPAPAKTAKASAASARGKQHMQLDAENDTMLQALAKLGGISRDVVQREFGLKPEEVKHTVKMGALKGYPFRKTGGMDMDRAITALQEAGYFDGVPDDQVRNTFEEAIYDELGGAGRRTSVGTMRQAQADYDAQREQDERNSAELDAEAQAEAEAERAAIMAEAGITEAEMASLTDDDIQFDQLGDQSEADTIRSMRAMGFTEQEIQDEIEQQRASADPQEAGQAARGQAQPADGARSAAPGAAGRAPGERGAAQADAGADQGRQEGTDQQDLTLSTQTEKDLRAKAERENAAKKADATKKAAEQERLRKQDEARDAKARADATVDDFQLGQSADQQLSGIGDLFSQPPAKEDGTRLPPTKADMIDSATKQYTALYREMAMGGRWHVYASEGSANGVAIHQDGTAPDGITDVLVQDVQAMQARTMVNALSSELDRRNEAPPAKQKKAAAPRQGARSMGVDGRATDGGPINPGDVFRTASGRETSGFPKQKGEKYASQWLIENAAAEADARGDDFNAPTFRATKPMRDGSLAPADRDSMLEYLFGNQPDVRPSILKPLVDTVRAPQLTGRDLAVPERLSVTFGGKTYQVESIADAQAKWVKFQETAGAGVSEVGNGIEVVNQDGRMVGRISFNGRAWDADGNLVAEAPAGLQPAKPAQDWRKTMAVMPETRGYTGTLIDKLPPQVVSKVIGRADELVADMREDGLKPEDGMDNMRGFEKVTYRIALRYLKGLQEVARLAEANRNNSGSFDADKLNAALQDMGKLSREESDRLAAYIDNKPYAEIPQPGQVVNGKERTVPAKECLLLMPCSAEKRIPEGAQVRAIDAYAGVMWKSYRAHVDASNTPTVAILSAEHGLLTADTTIGNYDRMMDAKQADKFVAEAEQLARRVLVPGASFKDVMIVGGAEYRRVMRAVVSELMKQGKVEKSAAVREVSGGIGEHRQQLGQYLDGLAGIDPKAVEREAGLVVIPPEETEFTEGLKELASELTGDRSGGVRHSFAQGATARKLPRATSANPKPAGVEFLSQEQAQARIQSWKAEAARQGKAETSNADRTVISLFDASGVMSQPWIDAGYNVVSYDLQTGQDINDFSAEMLQEVHGNDKVWAVIAQPPCTDFALSGAQYWKQKDADGRTEASNELVRQTMRTIEMLRPPVWWLENPLGRIQDQTGLPDPTLVFDPWHFGDPWTKRTQYFGDFSNDAPLAPVEPTEGSKIVKLSSGAKYERSLTPEGVAYAMFMANNAAAMSPAQRLTAEFKGVGQPLFQDALDAGVSEYDVRTAIEDDFYDDDIEGVKKTLADMAKAPTDPQGPAKPAVSEATRELLSQEKAKKDAAASKGNERRRAVESLEQLAERAKQAGANLFADRLDYVARHTRRGDAGFTPRHAEGIAERFDKLLAKALKDTSTLPANLYPQVRANNLRISDGDSEAIRQAKADAMKALGDIADIMGKGTRLNMMPEQEQKLLPVLTRLFDAAFRLGYLKFKEAARFALDQIRNGLGDEVANQITLEHLQGGYIGMSGRYRDQGADTVMDVAKVASLDAINDNPENEEPNDVPDPIDDLERDRTDAGDAPRDVAAGGIVDGLADRTRTPGIPPVTDGGRLPGDSGVSVGQAPARRAPGDQPVRAGNRADGPQEFPARGADGQRSDDPGIDRVQPDAIPASEVARAAVDGLVTADKRAAQRAAQTVKVIPGDLANARQSLPFLLPEQQEDAIKAEVKLSEPEGYGMLFTNGTGTGKTYSGLGLVKRFERQGKTNILLVVPDNKIMDDWVQSAKDLQLQVTPLRDTKDAGAGITITTYANFGDNDAVVSRSWDLVVADEAHMLMQAKDGTTTKALEKLRAITLHPRGMMERFSSLNRDDLAEQKRLSQLITDNERTINNPDTMDDHVAQLRAINAKTEIKLKALTAKLDAEREKVREFIKANQGAKRPRAAFLSATPFAWEATVDWADGYLFDYNEGYPFDETSLGYNDPTPREHFFITHFGYRKRYGKLTQPDAKVDSGLMQRQFNGWLKKRGSLSGRMLEVKADYDRRFVLVDSAIGNQIDQAIGWLEEQARAKAKEDKGDDGQAAQANGFRFLNDELRTALYGPDGHLTRRYLLEAIKAKEVIPLVRAHMELGRKVVVFHDFKKGGSLNPFRFSPSDQMDPATARTQAERDDITKHNADAEARNAAIEAFAKKFPDLAGDKLLSGLLSPIARFTREFPNVLLINGDEKPKDLLARYKTFNDDAVGPVVALVQSDKDKGWSGHDTTGKHQRVLFNLGLPTKPTKTIQQEGRIYRTGQVTDAMFRYLNTGTNWERWAFADTIAKRSGTAENLASGEQARALTDAFIAAYEESDAYPPGFEGEGKGGKERDRLANNIASEFDRAVAFYWGTQKKTAKTKAQEGTDYFATPEPLGLKMTQWTNPRGGEDAMEPSAGHGAIARWFGINLNRTAVEPSNTLGSRLALVFDGRIVSSTFEELHVSNKFDVIAMNPPFRDERGSPIDVKHVAKAANHLREYGRISALIPEGPAADKRFDKWFYGEDTRPTRPLATLTFNGRTQEVRLGDTVDAAGAKGELRDVIADGTVVRIRIGNDARLTNVNVRDIKTIAPTGKQTETYRPAEGLHMVGEVKLPGVAFERAGTNVRTRVVILEKLPEGVQPPPARRHDLSDIDDINELFARLENIDMAPRVKPAEVEDDANQAAPSQATEKAAAKAEKAQARTEGAKVAEAAGMQMVEHTTGKGKVLKGVVRKDLTQAQAKEFDAYTFKKDGGWFIRAEHVPKMIQAGGQDDGPNFSMAVGSEAPFYSELARQVDAANINNASGQAWTQYLDALAKRGTIKADELEWTGLREWLQMQPAKVKREQVAEFLRANGVQVQDVVLGEAGGRFAGMSRAQLVAEHERIVGYDPLEDDPDITDQQLRELLVDYARESAAQDGINEDGSQTPKFKGWTVPGGKNYREVLLTLPVKAGGQNDLAWRQNDSGKWAWFSNGKQVSGAFPSADYQDAARGSISTAAAPAGVYKSGHWDQPNVLAHIRVDERTDADGKRVLFVQEIQSDWGQEGKKKGVFNPAEPYEVFNVQTGDTVARHSDMRAAAKDAVERGVMFDYKDERTGGRVPPAPFITKTDAWVGLAIKRVVKMAADEGFDRVAFTTGQQAADLFDLSKQVERIDYDQRTKNLVVYDKTGGRPITKTVTPQELPDVIGKEAAEKLLKAPGLDSGFQHSLRGLNLQVGGEGMRTFYDQIVPKVAREVLKKVGGGQLGRVELGQAGAFDKFEGIEGGRVVHTFDTRSGAARWVAMGAEDGIQREMKPVGRMPQPGFDITPEMRAKAAQGLPLFSQDARPSLASLGITPIGGAPTFKAGASGNDVAGVGGVNEGTISKADLDAIARDLSRGWRGLTGGQIVAVDSWRDLPEQIVQDALRKRFNPAGIEGVEFHGKVYLVASAITSREQAERIVFHEVLGHMGLKGALGGSPNARLNQLWDSMNGLAGVTKLAKAYEAQPGKTVWDRLQPYIRATEGKPVDVRRSTIMNELIAFLAQARDERPMTQFKGYLADLKAAVVFLLRRLGAKTLATKLDRAGTELDVLALVRDARKAIVTGKTAKGEPFQFVYGGSPNKPGPQFSINQGDDLSRAKAKAGLPAKKGLGKAVRDYLADRVALAMDIVRNRNNAASDAWLNAQQGALDQFTGIANAVRRDVGNLPAEQDPYIAARLANGGTSAVMRGLLMHGKARWAANGQHLEKVPGSKGLLQILEPLGDDLNDWFGWMVGNRAARLLAEGRENNFTAAEIKALQGLAGPAGGEKRVLFNKVAVQYADFKRSVLDVAQGAGLIDAEARKVWDHADYIPFYRQIDERASFSPTGRKGLAGQSSGIRTLKGGSAALNDPMENLLMNFSRLVDASLKNNALRKTVDTLGDGPAISKIGYDMKPAIVPRSEIEKSLEASGVPEELLALLPPELFEGMAKMWSITQPADSDVIRVMRGGKPEFYRVHDPLLLRAATSFVPYDFPGLAAARWFKRVLTQTVTATPEFMLRNFIRDTASTQMTGRDKVKLRDVVKGIADSYRETGAAEAMLFAGASFQSGNVNAADPTGTARGIRRALRRRGFDASSIDSFLGTVVDKGLLGWERYRDMTDAVENANREAVYKAAMAAGNSPTEAAYQAKDLMDFSLRGSHPLYQVLADTLPFFNARIQGLYRVGRSDPKRLARYGAIMLVASLALAAYNAGEDWYEELPDWDKDTYWHIKVGGQHFRIPKPFELGVIFSTLPERILRNLIGVDSGNKTAARVWANIRDQLAIDLVPQMIRPGLNVWANKDSFRDAPIENESDEGKLPFMRYDGRTSATMKALTSAAPGLSNALGASPKKLEYLVGGYFGTAGMWALALSDSAVRAATGAAPSPAPRADDLPVIRAFYRVDPARSTVFESDLYAMREQVEKIHKSVQALRKEGRDDEADAMEAEDVDKLAAREMIQATTRRLAELNKRRNAIYADRDMTPAEKREALDEIQLERNELVREVMTSDAVKAADR